MSARAIVIGAGFGGLAAALRLRARGYSVRVIDRLAQPGGRATTYRRSGFVFDAGPTIITAPFLIDELFALYDRKIEDYVDLRPVEPWYRIRFTDGRTFDYGGSMDEMLQEIERFEPSDVEGYREFLRKTEDIYRVGFEELGDRPFSSRWSMLRLLPKLIRLQSFASVFQRTARFVKDPALRQVFSFHPLLVGGNPFTTTSIYSLIHYLERRHGVHFAMGGTGALVEGLARLARENGIEFELDTTVDEILVEDGAARGVRLAGGDTRRSEIVVANADAPAVYKRLLRHHSRRRWTDAKIERQKYSMGLFVLYFGTTRTYPNLAHHEILLGPRYRGLINDIFNGDKLPEDFSVYLHAPTRTDPSMAPPGCESMYALVPVPNLDANVDWSVEGPRLRDRLVRFLEETVCPDLSSHIVEDFYVTPEHFKDRLLSERGAGFSIQPILTQSAFFRFHNRSEEVRDLYLVGAGTHPGAGLPGVLTSAKVLENVLPERLPVRATAEIPARETPGSFARIMARRAKTFDLASRLIPSEERRQLQALYAFCRHVDDLADRSDDPGVAAAALARIERDLAAGRSTNSETAAFLRLARERQIPVRLALDLVEGARSDLGRVRYETPAGLLRYAYRVASSVGVMICHVFNVRSLEAHRFAVDLGLAMQLTNIARDVAEDLEAERVYLPAAWLTETDLRAAAAGRNREAMVRYGFAIRRLLELADRHYDSAERGIRLLPKRVRWGILTAARAYRAIGDRIVANPEAGLQGRMFVSLGRKLLIAASAARAVWRDPKMRFATWADPHRNELHEAIEDLVIGAASGDRLKGAA